MLGGEGGGALLGAPGKGLCCQRPSCGGCLGEGSRSACVSPGTRRALVQSHTCGHPRGLLSGHAAWDSAAPSILYAVPPPSINPGESPG